VVPHTFITHFRTEEVINEVIVNPHFLTADNVSYSSSGKLGKSQGPMSGIRLNDSTTSTL
jgi:hypothetical protein